jgi:cytochrome c oxidase cbb3-type subunit 3
LRDDDWLYGVGTVSDIEQVVKYGIRSHHPKAWNLAIMPAYATPRPSARDEKLAALSPANIRDLVEFLIFQQSINAKVAVTSSDKVAIAPATASAVARGAALFANVGGCYDCHAADAKGDAAIGAPNLIDRVTLYGDGSQDALTASISYGRAGVCPAWDTRISSAGIRELSVYVYSLSQPEARN